MSESSSITSTGLTPIYTYSIPEELISNFQFRQFQLPESHPLAKSKVTPIVEETVSSLGLGSGSGLGGAFNCSLTGASFNDLNSLKEHYKTDWFKFNVKLKSQNKPTPISEEEFNTLVEGLSLSGSDSSSSDEGSEASSTNPVSRLIRKQKANVVASGGLDEDEIGSITGPRSAILWFEAPTASPSTQYGIYRAALPVASFGKKREDGPEVLAELKSLQLPEQLSAKAIKSMTARGIDVPVVKERKWVLMMFGGGHFAAMIVSLTPRFVHKGKGKEKEREVVIIESKTFHRYTTRRKQGGSQSSNDNAKGNAKSAGASIRRYNESALAAEVQELLISWKDEIDDAELVFLRANKTHYKTFFEYEGSPMTRKDPRIRGFSFPTRRPTISELVRAFTELTRVKISHLSSEALAALDAAYIASITPAPAPVVAPPKPVAPKPVVIKMSKEQELERDRWTRLVDMVRKGRIEVLSSFLDKYGPELETGEGVWGKLPSWMDESRTMPTLLHIASAADQTDMTRWLLVEKRSDPTLAASNPPATVSTTVLDPTAIVPTTQRPILTPYELAPSRLTRNVFRLLTMEHPEWWDWTGSGPDGARVPSGLSAEKEEERERKAQEQRDRLRAKQVEREKEQAAREALVRETEEAEKAARDAAEIAELLRTKKSNLKSTGPRRLGGAVARILESRDTSGGGGGVLSEAAQMRVDRERRARAAEARGKAS